MGNKLIYKRGQDKKRKEDGILEYRGDIVTASFKMSGEIGGECSTHSIRGTGQTSEDWGGHVGCGS